MRTAWRRAAPDQAGQRIKPDASRCAIYLPNTKNFPLNTEVEATLTFAGDEPGKWVRDVTPILRSITVREHHSFVQLPPPGYKPRGYDPRSSFFGISYMDYATPVERADCEAIHLRGTVCRKKIRQRR